MKSRTAKKFRMIFGLVGGLLVLTPWFPAKAESTVDPQPDMALIAQNCMGCHGIDGRNQAGMANIAGIPPSVMIDILKGYRDGRRPSTIMQRLMRPFSDQDIQDLAHVLEKLGDE